MKYFIKNILILYFFCISSFAVAKPNINNVDFYKKSNRYLKKETFKEFNFFRKPRFVTNKSFFNEKGEKVSLSDYKGKVLLVNLWSNACGVCILELPMLNNLQNTIGTKRFEVISIAVGWKQAKKIRKFFIKKGLGGLKAYSDDNKSFYNAIGALGFPTTMLIDRNGLEIGRTRGLVKWDSKEFISKVRKLTQDDVKKVNLQNFSWSQQKSKKKLNKTITKEESFFLNLHKPHLELDKRLNEIR